MTVVLTGFMGSGKTTVGESLADALALPFVDLDREIERQAGRSIRDIFAQSGEEEFRRLERRQLEAVLDGEARVVAAGGGTLVSPANLELARARSLVVWLNPAFSTLMSRIGPLGKSDRPLFRDEKSVFDLYRQRLDAYRQADIRIDVEAREEPTEVAARVALLMTERMCSI